MSEIVASHYDVAHNTLCIVCPALPSKVKITLPDDRGRTVYSARSYQYVYEGDVRQLQELVRQDHDFIVHLNECEAYPSSVDVDLHEWQMRELGIEVD